MGADAELLHRPQAGPHAWSDHRRFLDFAGRNAECRSIASFEPLLRDNPFPEVSVQPWPFFVERGATQGLGRVCVELDRLLKSVPERFCGNDPARIAAFYGMRKVGPVKLFTSEPNGIAQAISRFDFVETAEGFKCLEWNSGSGIGGLPFQALEPYYLACPPIAAFLAEHGLRASHGNTVGRMFRHIIRSTLRHCGAPRGVLNLALVQSDYPEQLAVLSPAQYTELYRAVLAAECPGVTGEVFVCRNDDLTAGEGGVAFRDQPVHAVQEQIAMFTDGRVYRAFKEGKVMLFSGPVSLILLDKRNLALLSERADSQEFTRHERDLLERHLPWTRLVVDAPARYDGRRMRIPEILTDRRERFVIKKGRSSGGKHVFLGRSHTAAQWAELVGRALAESGWVAQEYVESQPFYFLAGDDEVVRHDLIWGPFVFGDSFGGTFLRTQRCERGGVVNTHNGAQVSLLLEVEPADRPAPARTVGG